MRTMLFALLIALLATVPGVWLGTLWDNSETAYSEVAREILRTHDSIVMHLNGAAWYIQPPLYFWCAAACAKLFSLSSFAMRLPAVISTALMSSALALFTARMAGVRAARYAALLVSTILMQVILGRIAVMDAMLDACMTVGVLAAVRAYSRDVDRDARGGAFIAAAIAMALGFLTKGPVAIALPLLIILPWIWLERYHGRKSGPPRLSLILAAVAALAIIAPWFIVFSFEAGANGVREFLLHYTVGRYLGVIENQAGPWYYYLPVMILGAFPWTGVILLAIYDALRNRAAAALADSGRASLIRLGLLWTLLPALFFSFAQTKLPNYVAFAMPGGALLGALWLDELLPLKRRRVFYALATVPFFTALMLVAMLIFTQNNRLGPEFASLHLYAIGFFACLFVGAMVALGFLYSRRLAIHSPSAITAGTILAMSIVAIGGVPAAEKFKPMPQLAAVIRAVREPGDVVALQGVNGLNSLMYYTEPPITQLNGESSPGTAPANDPAVILAFAPRVLLIGPTRRPRPDPNYGRRRTVLAVAGKDTLFLIDGPTAAEKMPVVSDPSRSHPAVPKVQPSAAARAQPSSPPQAPIVRSTP